jgi:hypothetical protein
MAVYALMVFLGIFMFVFTAVALLALFVNRRQLVARFRGKPTFCFGFGLLVVFLSVLFVMPLGLTMLPYFMLPCISLEVWMSTPILVGGLFVMGLGFLLIIKGMRNKTNKTK